MLVKETRLAAAAAHAEIERAERVGEVISDAAAVTLASWFETPVPRDRETAALAHGGEFDPDGLCKALSYAAMRSAGWEEVSRTALAALAAWAESKTQHVAVSEINLTADEWAAWVDGYDTSTGEAPTPPTEWFVGATSRYRVATLADECGEWVDPGDPRYPTDATAGDVWVPGSPVDTAVEMIKHGCGTDFHPDSAGGDPFEPGDFWWQADPWQPGQAFASRYIDPHSGSVTIEIARLHGFSADDERAVVALAWPEGEAA